MLAPTATARPTSISIIVPVLNEAELIPEALSRLGRLAFPSLRSATAIHEIILVDGGSHDETVATAERCMAELTTEFDREIAASHLPRTPQLSLTSSKRGRAAQMNRGAELAAGDVLLFLHVDCQLPDQAAIGIRRALEAGHRCGSFRHRINDPRWRFRWIEWGDTVRQSWLQMPYGDQALFVERTLFAEVGGYPEVPLMEDVRLVRKLRRHSRLAVVQESVITDARRWQRRGALRQLVLNQFILGAERLGVSLDWLAKLYYR